MTDIDTAAIRAMYAGVRGIDFAYIRRLCDTVDAARAERDHWKSEEAGACEVMAGYLARAEAAEAHVSLLKREMAIGHDQWKERSQIAEARIAAALADCCRPGYDCSCCRSIRYELTKGH